MNQDDAPALGECHLCAGDPDSEIPVAEVVFDPRPQRNDVIDPLHADGL
jgi:hypothetical protein